jgi:hypothetical protein
VHTQSTTLPTAPLVSLSTSSSVLSLHFTASACLTPPSEYWTAVCTLHDDTYICSVVTRSPRTIHATSLSGCPWYVCPPETKVRLQITFLLTFNTRILSYLRVRSLNSHSIFPSIRWLILPLILISLCRPPIQIPMPPMAVSDPTACIEYIL